MLDQRLVRENPDLISSELERRGIDVDLKPLQLIAQQQRDLEEERSLLQAEGNRIGKEVGQRIRAGASPSSDEVNKLRFQGNKIKQKVSDIEEREKTIAANLKSQLLNLPNLPAPECPNGRSEKDNQEKKKAQL